MGTASCAPTDQSEKTFGNRYNSQTICGFFPAANDRAERESLPPGDVKVHAPRLAFFIIIGQYCAKS